MTLPIIDMTLVELRDMYLQRSHPEIIFTPWRRRTLNARAVTGDPLRPCWALSCHIDAENNHIKGNADDRGYLDES